MLVAHIDGLPGAAECCRTITSTAINPASGGKPKSSKTLPKPSQPTTKPASAGPAIKPVWLPTEVSPSTRPSFHDSDAFSAAVMILSWAIPQEMPAKAWDTNRIGTESVVG